MLRRNKDIALGYKDESYPPVPTKGTLFVRRCFFIQLFRFFVLNFKIMRIVIGGHK
ncbi:MAG: hypothetical protein JXR68_05995 [Bacteroidales bacterium]|nr:hypothetical protein [Bacteroidales bacterium]